MQARLRNILDAFAYAFSKADLPIAELENRFGDLAGRARILGVDIKEVLASVVELRNGGSGTAESITQMTAVMTALMNPGKKLAKVMQVAGVSMQSISDKGLVNTLSKYCYFC